MYCYRYIVVKDKSYCIVILTSAFIHGANPFLLQGGGGAILEHSGAIPTVAVPRGASAHATGCAAAVRAGQRALRAASASRARASEGIAATAGEYLAKGSRFVKVSEMFFFLMKKIDSPLTAISPDVK